ncbi:putative metallophosphoesterase domain-containing protein 1 [Monocercomonoides exilis]|uniref:putative metallophosphoesterase domain-containing protein 1 n=1 Tax=Monocercomonoides exilis TaxID=2049356 RepID=UPI00355AC719|nr:putative metallophosphoesterase domain-containing protein 1 [Monocercomonoides exilis]|eukprot:MONOS_5997.1-p1 / transcript=MONOS_5997.1 / gene=MONOS_5997 / organism=Monocercomonoides_exilis_PA203 / gene_product=metallophosphoesterase domain-containing protein 1 / transcript_product=metallophosphoesterase domain-containing protein 1 / location=Mono_scaffold00182:71568-72629(+) / protein_length=353 / sequence_SO=supercontig / SO=protein_coding / is_pseudo=false
MQLSNSIKMEQKSTIPWDKFSHKNTLDSWNAVKDHIIDIQPIPLIVREPSKTPKPNGYMRFVCMSDTHGEHDKIVDKLPEGDILLFAGDFTHVGKKKEIDSFCEFLKKLKFRHKIVIAGNHDIPFDKSFYLLNFFRFGHLLPVSTSTVKEELKKCCIYLEDEYIEINGIKIFGSPYQPTFGSWAFNLDRGKKLRKHWEKIPSNIDILLTHGPPMGRCDVTNKGFRKGDVDLLQCILERVHPKVHVFGHIHESHGLSFDGSTVFINASIFDKDHEPTNTPIVFDYPIPYYNQTNLQFSDLLLEPSSSSSLPRYETTPPITSSHSTSSSTSPPLASSSATPSGFASYSANETRKT